MGQEISHVLGVLPSAQIYEPGQTVGPVIQLPTRRVPEKVIVTVNVIVDVVGTWALVAFVEVI